MVKKIFLFLLIVSSLGSCFFLGQRFFSKKTSNPQVLAQVSTDWPQLQHDPQRTGYTPEEVDPLPGSDVFTTAKWRWNIDQNTAVKTAPMVQPIVAAGKVFIGDLEGKMNVLDMNTGQELWSYQVEKGIFHTAAYYDNKIYFTSDDSWVYCVDTLTRNLVWKYKTGAGIWTAPLVVNNIVYIGSRDKTFYALDAYNGALKWSYTTGGPILNSPAYSSTQNAVLFGSDDMYVYSLDANNGALNWKTKVSGQSFRDYWPVVADKHKLVIVTTMPNLPKRRAEGMTGVFYVLDLTTGLEKYTTPVTHTGGCGATFTPPVIDGSGDYMFAITSGTYMAPAVLGKIDLTNGNVTWTFQDGSGDFRLIGDESSSLSLSGSNLLVSMVQSIGGIDVTTDQKFHVAHERHPAMDGYWYKGNLAIFYKPEIAIYSSEMKGGHVAPPWAPGIVSNGMIVWISDGSGVIAVAP